MEIQIAANRLAELGHETRLAIYRHLVQCGPAGCPVGKLQELLAIPPSTLSHHIARLVSVGLVVQRREGRVLRCIPQFDAFNETLAYLTGECCIDRPASEGACESTSTFGQHCS